MGNVYEFQKLKVYSCESNAFIHLTKCLYLYVVGTKWCSAKTQYKSTPKLIKFTNNKTIKYKIYKIETANK